MMPGGCGRAPRAADTRPGESAENTSAVHRGRRRTDDQRVQKKMPPVLPRMPQGRTCAEAADASLRTRQEKKTAGLPSALADLMKRVQSCLNIRNSLGIIAPGTTDRTAPEPRFRHLRWHQTAFPVIVAQLPEPAAAQVQSAPSSVNAAECTSRAAADTTLAPNAPAPTCSKTCLFSLTLRPSCPLSPPPHAHWAPSASPPACAGHSTQPSPPPLSERPRSDQRRHRPVTGVAMPQLKIQTIPPIIQPPPHRHRQGWVLDRPTELLAPNATVHAAPQAALRTSATAFPHPAPFHLWCTKVLEQLSNFRSPSHHKRGSTGASVSRRRFPERVLLSRLRVNMSARLALSDESPAVEAPEHTDPAELAAGDPRHDASGFD